MELVDYLRLLRRQFVLVLLGVIVCAGVAFGASATATKQYRTTAQFNVSAPSSGAGTITDAQASIAIAESLAQYGTTPPAIQAAVTAAGYSGTGLPGVTTTAPNQSPFFTVTVSGSNAQLVAKVANAYLTSMPAIYVQLIKGTRADMPTLTFLSQAGVPGAPYTPNTKRNVGIGLVLGLVLGVGAAFLRDALDRTYSDPDVLEEAVGLSVLGVVPRELAGVELPTVTHPTSGRAESYRTVRTNLMFASSARTPQAILVTSATAGEGKTTVATNLAIAYSRTGSSVCLVDADMRKPRVARALGVDAKGLGLAELLRGETVLDVALTEYGDQGLSLITAGRPPGNPSELLGSTALVELLKSLRERFDVIIIDSPPVLPVSDPLILAVHVDSLIMVVRLGVTSRERITRAVSSMRKLKLPISGIVANGVVASGDAAYSYGYKYRNEKD